MSAMTSVHVPMVEGVGLEVVPPDTLKLKGTITRKEPSEGLSDFFRALHKDAVARRLPEFCIDVTELTFVNSSSIRLFIDWAVWAQGESGHRYVLKFRTSKHVTWQQTAFSALKTLMKEVVNVERV